MDVRRAALFFALLGACSSSAAPPASVGDGGLHAMTFPYQANRDVDVLFVIDDAPGMAPALQRLPAAFAAFTDTLKNGPGGYPNLHVAVVSSDLGAGASDVPGCRAGGDGGRFWAMPQGACTATGLPRGGQAFFSIVDGESNFDLTKSLADELSCVTVRDDAGCRFPQPLAAALRALGADGQPAPAANTGFLRPEAFLAIVLLTNQDDCSVPPTSTAFDPSSMYVRDPLGPLTTFRCAELGLSCGGRPPSRTEAGLLSGCQSAEDGRLLSISDVVSRLQLLKTDPNMILVAGLAGPPDPVTVELDPPGLPDDPQPWPSLAPSCTSGDGLVSARPAVRVEQWVYSFGHNGVLGKTCDDLASSMQTVATSIASVLGPPCLTGAFAKTTGLHGPRPDCTIKEFPMTSAIAPLVSCLDAAGEDPCWTLTDDAACSNGKLLVLEGPQPVDLGQNVSVQCVVCDDPNDPRCR